MESMKSVIYHKDVLEFVTVGVRYCAFLERHTEVRQKDFIETLLKLLPLLYLKALLLPRMEDLGDSFPEEFVTEQDYEAVRMQVSRILGERDAYLDLDLISLDYVQEPQMKSISEDLADVYQAVRNFVTTYKLEIESSMYEALVQVREQFDLYWGQTLLSGLRALHGARQVADRETDAADAGDLLDEDSSELL